MNSGVFARGTLTTDSAARWWQVEKSRECLQELAALVQCIGVEFLVFKGLLQAALYESEPWNRRMGDVDLLVVRGSYQRLVLFLNQQTDYEVALDSPNAFRAIHRESQVTFDIHNDLYVAGFGLLRKHTLLPRAQRHATFGPHVWIPDIVDETCILLANHVKNRLGRVGTDQCVADLRAITQTWVNSGKNLPSFVDALHARIDWLEIRHVALLAALSMLHEELCARLLVRLQPSSFKIWFALSQRARMKSAEKFEAFFLVFSCEDSLMKVVSSVVEASVKRLWLYPGKKLTELELRFLRKK